MYVLQPGSGRQSTAALGGEWLIGWCEDKATTAGNRVRLCTMRRTLPTAVRPP